MSSEDSVIDITPILDEKKAEATLQELFRIYGFIAEKRVMRAICDYCDGYEIPDFDPMSVNTGQAVTITVDLYDLQLKVCPRCVKKMFDAILLPKPVGEERS